MLYFLIIGIICLLVGLIGWKKASGYDSLVLVMFFCIGFLGGICLIIAGAMFYEQLAKGLQIDWFYGTRIG